jgi:hypothetical protein
LSREHSLAVDLNFILLTVELLLLIPTLLLLILGRSEAHGRQILLKQMASTAKMVSRQEYFNSVQFGMQNAVKSIKGSITGSPPQTPEQKDRVEGIVEQIRGAKSRNVTVQYLLPKTHDRIAIAGRYKEAGAELRYHSGLVVSDIRYMVVDEKYTVLGLPSAAGENEPTREGYVIPSEGLAQVLLQQFEERWSHAATYDDYLRDVLFEIKSHDPAVSCQLLSLRLDVSELDVKRILATAEKTGQ